MTGLCARQRREIRCRSRSTAKRPCEEENFLASWGCPARSGPTRKKLFRSRGGVRLEAAPREGSFSGLVGVCAVNRGRVSAEAAIQDFALTLRRMAKSWSPPEKEALKIRGVEKSKCQSDSPPKKKFLKIRGAGKSKCQSDSPPKKKFLKIRGAGKSKCQSDSPPKKKFLKIRGVVKSKFQARQPPENKKSSISGGLPGWQSGKSPPRERSF